MMAPRYHFILRKVLAWLGACAVLLGGFAWLAGWFSPRTAPGTRAPRASATRPPRTVEVVRERQPVYLPVSGRLRAAQRTSVSAEIPGKIAQLVVVAGDRIEPGALLVKLDSAAQLARVEQVREKIPGREAKVREAESQFERNQQLLADGAVSEQQYEVSRRMLAEAEAALAATREQLAEAESRLKDTSIRATMAGVVVDQLAKVGEVAQPGKPLLDIYQPSTLRLECAIPESLGGIL